MRRSLLAILLLCTTGLLWADSLETKTGDRFKGRVVRESKEQVVVRTEYGELTIPRERVKKHVRATYVVKLADGSQLEGQATGEAEGKLLLKVGKEDRSVVLADVKSIAEKKTPPRPKKLNPRQIIETHQRVLQRFKEKKYPEALADCKKILASEPEDNTALYNAACALARMSKTPEALDYLRKAVLAGFVNFAHIESDGDLESLREAPAFKELFAKKDHYTEQAAARAVERITESLAKRGIDAKSYKSVFDKERNFVYLHAKSDAELAELRRGLEAYADFQWRTLFQNKPKRPLYIVVVRTQDVRKVFRGGALGWYNPAASALFCSDMPVHKLLRTDVVIHEFTHALHFADMMARHQRHPIWLIEGLATLFEASDRNGGATPRHSYRLHVVQEALRQGRALPWKAMMGLDQMRFLRQAQLAYAQARYMLFYMHEKGLLKRFYDEYTAKGNYAQDRTAMAAFEVVFGRPIEVVERDWKQWVLAQKVPPIPFLGVQTREKGKRLEVMQVVNGSPAKKAGLEKGDVITGLSGRAIDSQSDLMEVIGNCEAGDEVEVKVTRGDKKLTLTAKLGTRTDIGPRPARRAAYLGLTVAQKDKQVVVQQVAKGSPAEKAGLKPGAAIVEFDGKKVESVRQYFAALRAAKPGKKVAIKTREGEQTRTVSVTLAELTK